MLSAPRENAGRNVTQGGKAAIAFVTEFFQIFAGFGGGVAAGGVGRVLIVRLELRIIFFQHQLDALAEADDFGFRQMRQHFADGPAIGGRLPVQLLLAGGPHDFFDDDWSLLQDGEARQRVWAWGSGHRILRKRDAETLLYRNARRLSKGRLCVAVTRGTPKGNDSPNGPRDRRRGDSRGAATWRRFWLWWMIYFFRQKFWRRRSIWESRCARRRRATRCSRRSKRKRRSW